MILRKLHSLFGYCFVLLLLAVSCAWAPAFAQSPRFVAEANAAKIGTSDLLSVVFRLSYARNIQDISVPKFDGFLVLSTQQSMINNSELTISVTLQPKQPGVFVIPGAVILAGNTRIESNGLRITVVPGQVLGNNRQQQRNQGNQGNNAAAAQLQQMMRQLMQDDDGPGSSMEEMMRRQQQAMEELIRRQGGGMQQQRQQQGGVANNLFIIASPSKTSAYIGEPITVTYKIYTRLNFEGGQISKLPALNGFYTKDFDLPMPPAAKQDVYNGRQFMSFLIKKSIISATQTGQLTIDPLELNIGTYDYGNLTVRSLPVPITIKPLPSPAPASFSGAVGSYALSASVDKSNLTTNDVAVLNMTLRGKGNITLAQAPKVLLPDALAGSEAEVDKVSDGGIDGQSTKEFSISISPTSAGNFTIPPIEYSYFDPAKGQYVSIKTEAITLEVKEGNTTAGKVTAKQAGSGKLQDIYQGALGPKNTILLVAQPWFWPLLLLILLAPLLLYAYRRWQEYNANNAGAWQLLHADKTALKRLKKAKSLLSNPDKNLFYTEVSHAVWLYLAHKLGMQLGDLSKENISTQLTAKGVATELQERMLSLLVTCEQALYSPMGEQQQRQAVLQTAADIISEYERTWS